MDLSCGLCIYPMTTLHKGPVTHQRSCNTVTNSRPIGGTIRRSTSLLKARLVGPGVSRQSVDKAPLVTVAKAKLVVLKTQRRLVGVGMLICPSRVMYWNHSVSACKIHVRMSQAYTDT